jgi:uncharacterized protein YukJ
LPINYFLLKGRPINYRLATAKTKHYQILISVNGSLHRVAVNTQSADGSEVEFLVRSDFEHPITDQIAGMAEGLHPVPSGPGGAALDYIRGNLAQPWEFTPLPLSAAGPDNDLNEKLDAYVQRAMADEKAMVYAFGAAWGPEPDKADAYFGFLPGRGIHDIHMNQGNPAGRFAADNGPWQDGGLLIHFPENDHWVALFMKFQTQAWHTDDLTGHPIVPSRPDHPGRPYEPIARDLIPRSDLPDGLVRIIAALVNDSLSPERETITLLNTANVEVSLAGWRIKDQQKNSMVLDGSIGPGATRVIAITAPVMLSNQGGIITLVDANGVKVHGVSYTKAQARQPGRTIPFQN